MNKKLIRLTEGDLHRIVKESVKKVLNEIGGTPEGQKLLGSLHARKQYRDGDESNDIYRYAEKARGGDSFDSIGDNVNPLYKDFNDGWHNYIDSHEDVMHNAAIKNGATSTLYDPYKGTTLQYRQ